MALDENRAFAILLALLRKPGPPDAVAGTFREILDVHRRHFGDDPRPGAPASVYLKPRRPKPRPQRTAPDPIPEQAIAPAAASPEAATEPDPEPEHPRDLYDWPRSVQGPLPRIPARPLLPPRQAATPTAEPAPLDRKVHARLTSGGRSLCASCAHGTYDERSETKFTCALRANECVPAVLGKLYSPKSN